MISDDILRQRLDAGRLKKLQKIQSTPEPQRTPGDVALFPVLSEAVKAPIQRLSCPITEYTPRMGNPLTKKEVREIHKEADWDTKIGHQYQRLGKPYEQGRHAGRTARAREIAWDYSDRMMNPPMLILGNPGESALRKKLVKYVRGIYGDEPTPFDVEAAIYWFAANYHGGQSDPLYSVLSESRYKPGISERGPEPGSMEGMIYESLAEKFGGSREENPMKLLTKADLKRLPKIGGQEKLGMEAVAYVKFFTPWTNWTWYMTEYDPTTGEAFGLVQGFEEELGYFSVPELLEIRGPAGLKIERDLHFDPTPISRLRRGVNPHIVIDPATNQIQSIERGHPIKTFNAAYAKAKVTAARLGRSQVVVAHPYVPPGFKKGVEVSPMFYHYGAVEVDSQGAVYDRNPVGGPHHARQLVANQLRTMGLPAYKLSARTVGFGDLARGAMVFVKIFGWSGTPGQAQEVERVALHSGFRIEFAGFPRGGNPADDEGVEGCSVCGGPVGSIGNLGGMEHFQCRNCGMQFMRPVAADVAMHRREVKRIERKLAKDNLRMRKGGRI